MEKIIYNTKLKKIVVATLIIMIVFYAMVPIVFAAVMSFDPKQFIYDQGGIPQNADKNYDWDINDWIITAEKKQTMLNNYRSTLNDPDLMQNPIYVKEVNDMVDAYGLGIDEYNNKITQAKNQGKSLQEALNIATGEAADVGDGRLEDLENDVVDENGEEDFADLGGILLSPIFYLVNFIADAITSNLGRIMLGNDPTLANLSGVTVLQDQIITSIDGKSDYVEIEADLDNLIGDPQYPNIPYTPEEIFAGKIDLLSIDFISGKNAEGQTITGDWTSIRVEIAKWYKVLRMVAIIGLLSVLIYTGIKIIISANAKDKAKYKEWIINWFLAVAILFAMHFIMAFIISVTGEFSKLINNACQGIRITGDGKGTVTNLMGLVRFMIQSEDFYKKVAYEVMYIALLVYTIKFTLLYLKRVLNMAFLTLIAPIVALTYPIDKINDGKAQGFDMWLKEYIFNALLQPMHQIMYYILVGSAVSIAASNPIYGIVVLMFLTEAEKLLKRIFGFDKASGGTVGGMAGAFAAGAIASNIKNIARMSKLPGGNGGKSGADGSGSSNSLMDNIKYEKDKGIAEAGHGFSNAVFDSDSPSGGATVTQAQPEDNSEEQNRRQLLLEQSQEDSQLEEQQQNSPQRNQPGELPKEEDEEDDVDFSMDDESDEQDSDETTKGDTTGEDDSSDGRNNNPIRKLAANAKNRAKTAYENNVSEGTRKKIARVGQGAWNVVDKGVIKKFHDKTREEGYNKDRWKRRLKNAGKGALKAAAGASLGVAAAAVQAGISITDGKYNPLEGAATFAAGYAGGSKLAGSVGGKVANTFNEGYYSGDAGQKDLIKKKQNEFYHSDDVHKKYVNDWGEKDANNMKKLAKDNLVNYGITDTKKQKQILKLANKIAGKDGLMGATPEMQKAAVDRARRTSGFIDQLESQGQRSVIGDPDKQQKYIDSIIKSQKLDATNAADKERIDKITKDYNAAFKSASLYYQVNK